MSKFFLIFFSLLFQTTIFSLEYQIFALILYFNKLQTNQSVLQHREHIAAFCLEFPAGALIVLRKNSLYKSRKAIVRRTFDQLLWEP